MPDGNKRVAWVAVRMFVEIKVWSWSERPSVDEAEQVVLAIAAGEWMRTHAAEWLGEQLAREPGGPPLRTRSD